MLRYVLRREEAPGGFDRPEDMPDALYELLAGRGIATPEEAEAFLHPGMGDLLEPFRLNDMAAAVARVQRAMDAGEVICVYGDYDVDGVCASAILSGYLRSRGADARVYLPSRHREGYGLNEAAIRQIADWASLMVTVDCGVTSVALVALAKDLGLDVVVTDHHRPGEALPDCPVVNPLLGDYPFPHLCGAGVAWKLVWALADSRPGDGGRREELPSLPEFPAFPSYEALSPGARAAMPWADVAALATVADVVPLTGENRAIVYLGLGLINFAPRCGIAALIDAAGLGEQNVTSTNIAFGLAPRLNAGGRLGSANRSLELVLAQDPQRARALAAELEAENTRRKAVEQRILREAEAQLEDFDFLNHRALILAGKDWNPGVIGLAASRLVEKYNYPVVLLADQGEKLTGSCRSIEGVDIHAALTGCADTILQFGGHRQAAGLTLLPEQLEPFRRAMDAWLEAHADPDAYIPVQVYDAYLDFESATLGLIVALARLQPTGFGNPAPLFRAMAEVVEARAVGADKAHLKLTLAQEGHRIDGIAFREGHRADRLSDSVDVLFALKMNSWMGRSAPQLEVKALTDGDVFDRLASKVSDEDELQCNFLTQIFYNKKIPPFSGEEAPIRLEALREKLERRPQGTLIAASDFDTALWLLEVLADMPLDLYLGELPTDPRAFNALCVCPSSGTLFRGYESVVLAGFPENRWPWPSGATLYRLEGEGSLAALMPDLDQLRQAYKALMRVTSRPAWCRSLYHLAGVTAGQSDMEAATAAAAILAMADMGLFELELDAVPIVLRRSGRAKANPEESPLWNALQRWRGGEPAQ